MDSQVTLIVGAIVRQGLASVGGYLVAQGLLDSSQVEPGVGATMVLGAIVWSIGSKLVAKKRAAK